MPWQFHFSRIFLSVGNEIRSFLAAYSDVSSLHVGAICVCYFGSRDVFLVSFILLYLPCAIRAPRNYWLICAGDIADSFRKFALEWRPKHLYSVGTAGKLRFD